MRVCWTTLAVLYGLAKSKKEKFFIVCGPLQFLVSHLCMSDCSSYQIQYAAFLKHGTGHGFKRLGWSCPATLFFAVWCTKRGTLSWLAPRNTYCGNTSFGEQVAESTELDIANGSLFMCVSSSAGVTCLRCTVLMSPNKDETAVHCCDPALSVLVMFGVSKRLSRCTSLAVYCLYNFVFFDWLDFL